MLARRRTARGSGSPATQGARLKKAAKATCVRPGESHARGTGRCWRGNENCCCLAPAPPAASRICNHTGARPACAGMRTSPRTTKLDPFNPIWVNPKKGLEEARASKAGDLLLKSVFTQKYERLLAHLIAARKASGLTQQDLADKLHKPQSFVSKYERGERRLYVVEFMQIAEAIGIMASNIISGLEHEGSSSGDA